MDLDSLYSRVTDAIMRANALDDLGDVVAQAAHLEVSLLEERIAESLPASDPEGMIARRGAIRAAVDAGDIARAEMLVSRFAFGAPSWENEQLQILLHSSRDPIDSRYRDDQGQGILAPVLTRPPTLTRLGQRLIGAAIRALYGATTVGSSVVVTRNSSDILLIHYRFQRGRSVLPGGFVRRGEDPALTAARELREETGICSAFVESEARVLYTEGHISFLWRLKYDAEVHGRLAHSKFATVVWHRLDSLPEKVAAVPVGGVSVSRHALVALAGVD